MSTLPPKKRPGAPTTQPPPDEFDEEAPTSVKPGRPAPAAMPKQFDEGGALQDEGVLEPAGPADDAEDVTNDRDDDADGHAGPGDAGGSDEDATPPR
jgi:hypothetical protein